MARHVRTPFSDKDSERSHSTPIVAYNGNPSDIDLFRTLTETSIDVICLIGSDNRAKYFSPSVTQLLGWTPDELVGATADFLVIPEDLHVIASATERHMKGDADASTLTYRVRRRDGTVAWVEATARTIPDPTTGGPGDTVAVLRDISKRKANEEELTNLAMLDALTGLANRRAFDQALEREWLHGVRTGGVLSLLLIDLDCFKMFNDRYGHQSGDECLQTIAGALIDTLPGPRALAARYGGEEFVILLPTVSDIGAAAIAERQRAAIHTLKIPHAGRTDGFPWITASLGTATVSFQHLSLTAVAEDLFNVADEALYRAKRLGRNQVAQGWLALPKAAARILVSQVFSLGLK